jgi:hypothetical protein
MKQKLFKKHKSLITAIIGIFILVLGCFALSSPAGAIDTLLQYPQVPGTQPVAFGMPLTELIKYIYLFAIGICGAVALAAILLGAIKYIGAAGNPSKMSDAKEQIVSALLGVVILLSSYLILNTINPDLVGIKIDLSSTTNINAGGRTCYCAFEGAPEPWDCYISAQECNSMCDNECQWWGGYGSCRADANYCP